MKNQNFKKIFRVIFSTKLTRLINYDRYYLILPNFADFLETFSLFYVSIINLSVWLATYLICLHN